MLRLVWYEGCICRAAGNPECEKKASELRSRLKIDELGRRRGARLVPRLAPVSLDGGVRPGPLVGPVRHFIQCVFNALPTMLKLLSLGVSRYEHWLAND